MNAETMDEERRMKNDELEKEKEDDLEYRGEFELLREENRRLRNDYRRIRQKQYRRTAVGLLVTGVFSVVAAQLAPMSRDVLYALGFTGVFGGILVYYLTPERFVTASVAEHIYDALRENESDIVSELDLEDSRYYLPTPSLVDSNVRLYIPLNPVHQLPTGGDLDSVFTLGDEDEKHGVSFHPVGDRMVQEVEKSMAADSDDVASVSNLVVDAVVGDFELVESADWEKHEKGVTVGVEEPVIDPGLDDPVTSFIASGYAYWLEENIEVEISETERYDHLIEVRFVSSE